ncbi:alginate lyase family protein [Actinomadura rupiterrae]|uniref:alginate lyase family protein n=1 Tax=Actinomadura rupiterrae TaxID=559627 RepID=UPI0020A25F80|nr:alginate lyase family protein [Actinomadura rupiterrae]MCP2334859.1 hypothetical protein [Actinomadura rupiterrae]
MAFTRSRVWLASGAGAAVVAASVVAVAWNGASGASGGVEHAAGTVGSTSAAGFKHPGVLVGKAQLDAMRSRVKAGKQPQKKAYDAMLASKYADLARTPKPRANVECGSGSNPNHGCTDERDDAMAAYTDALAYTVNHDQRYAAKAVQLMDAWANVLKEHTNSNAPLQAGWAANDWARAAEIVKYSPYGTKWKGAKKFASFLRTVYLPVVNKGRPTTNGNWELIMTDATISIAVHTDDRATFNQAVARWRKRLPEYIYLKKDGPLPKVPAGISGKAATIKYWSGQSTFVDGLAQETCRDFGHTGWALDAATHVAETAHLQGLDLYKEGRERLTKAMEFHAQYDLGTKAPSWLCKGAPKTGVGPVFEIGYNEFHHRLGLSLPKTGQLVTSKRPAGPSYFLGWETLTHADAP